ncbi:hypothetical protein VTN77DRAFT_7732 [Rasamsonia byssochlamydoides]|uniref:uncharacterized protein n=1 Tax=Rasamsonia byssochlamydoides TaxID=89139 RepID=UPI00374323D8
MTAKSSSSPLSGLWQPQDHLKHLYYGPGCVQKHLLDVIPSAASKVFIITGTSIATKTPLIQQLEALLGDHHAGTFSGIKQHGQVAEVDQATEIVAANPSIDTILSVGGGSPIDSAKTISYRMSEKRGKFLTHLSIPTTLSAAETTAAGGYTKADGVKTGFAAPGMGISAIFYDAEYARHTPKKLWLATGMRAVDHAVESYYHPCAIEMPWKALSHWALATLFECLPKAHESHPGDQDVITRLQLAAFASVGFHGKNFKGGMGLSHSLGHALGSPYGIPHGETSCITLGQVVKFKAKNSPEDARQIARLLSATGGTPTADNYREALEVGDRILGLVDRLGLRQSLTERGISRDEIPRIVQRVGGGLTEETYGGVVALVEGFF